MADKGPILTSCIIFFLSIGAAIFQILEEPNWKLAKSNYLKEKENILKSHGCLTKEDLDHILQVVAEAAGQGVTIIGEKPYNNWDWGNSVIFAATIVTTIGYGNVAPKTVGGRIFCILYGLCGIPLCLVWISELGSFFGDRAKRLSMVLISKGLAVKKVQFTCTALFLLWGLLVHLVIPPFVFMSYEGWSYLEGLYFSFITLTTVGFGDYVAGVNADIDYPRIYRMLVELWIYMGLAWLSLFFSWNVHMVVEAHKVLKKRRHKHRLPVEERKAHEELTPGPHARPTAIDIFNYLSEGAEDYSTVIKKIGTTTKKQKKVCFSDQIVRSKSCSDLLAISIQTLDHSPQRIRKLSISDDMLLRPMESLSSSLSGEEGQQLIMESWGDSVFSKDMDGCACFVESNMEAKEEEIVQHPDGGMTRFVISKVVEENLREENDEKE
ncbi:potassium channel subfamily K member 5-like [Aplochiton taeniatus]